jgi:hypothetical protein
MHARFTLEVGNRRDDRSGAGLTCYFFDLWLLTTSRFLLRFSSLSSGFLCSDRQVMSGERSDITVRTDAVEDSRHVI